jgi:putative hydrolase of the HAD superfamily
VTIAAALFDFGGVVSTSPFEAFARYERERGLPDGFIRMLNSTNPDANAWARLERSEVNFEEFCQLYEGEARAAGFELDARQVMVLLGGDIRPAMVEAIRRCSERLKTAILTNNFVRGDANGAGVGVGRMGALGDWVDAVIESSKLGFRKPDPRFYYYACEVLEIEPNEAVFLDDLGVNLKPARELGMTTIKVSDADTAIAELEAVVGFQLRRT